jgi:hypothetical protein
MNKPVMKRKIGILYAGNGAIRFNAQYRIGMEFKEFGELIEYGTEHFVLSVDARFDFDEVVKYIQEYKDSEWEEEMPF